MEKSVLITGASKGIGKALANIFAKNGYSLLLVARNKTQLEELQTDLKNKYQCTSKILSVDLNQPDSIDIILETFKEDMNKLDILINNAGYGLATKFTNMPEKDVEGIINVNITALTKLTYRVLPFMLARKSGQVLNVASTAAFAPGPYMAMYYASKAYVLSFSRALYEEYKKDGITISALCPGITKTEFQDRAGMHDTKMMSGMLPMMSAEAVAELAYKGLMKKKRMIITGFMNKMTVMSMCLTPSFLSAKVTAWIEKPKNS